MKKSLLIALSLASTLSIADPSPFGLEIGKASIQDVKGKYSLTSAGINKYSQGKMYEMNPSELNFQGIQSATLIFSTDEKLLAVLTKMSKHKFDYVYNGLKKKYHLTSKQIPFVGNKKVKFVDGNTEITLNAPHMSFEMDMNYINNDLWSTYQKTSKAEKNNKTKQEQSQL